MAELVTVDTCIPLASETLRVSSLLFRGKVCGMVSWWGSWLPRFFVTEMDFTEEGRATSECNLKLKEGHHKPLYFVTKELRSFLYFQS